MTKTLKERLKESTEKSKEVLEQLTSDDISRDEFRKLMSDYVGYRFFLEPDEMFTGNILVEKLLRINDLSVSLSEGSITCTNQKDTDIKKVLLSLTLQRALNVQFTPAESADLDTIDKLACALYDAKSDPNRARA